LDGVAGPGNGDNTGDGGGPLGGGDGHGGGSRPAGTWAWQGYAHSDMSDNGWIHNWGTTGSDSYFSMYGLSEPLTITPEPATLALLGLGGVGMLLSRKRK